MKRVAGIGVFMASLCSMALAQDASRGNSVLLNGEWQFVIERAGEPG